jgi:hypothetical protein
MMGRVVTAMCLLCAVGSMACVSTAAAASTPPNDDFAQAQAIAAPFLNTYYDTAGGTKEAGEPDPHGLPGGASVWFDWTAEWTGGADVNACTGWPEVPLVAVYSGDAVSELTPTPEIFGEQDCEYGFKAIAGVTYRIDVDGATNPASAVSTIPEGGLGVYRFPSNDNFEAALDLGQASNTGGGTQWGSRGATEQPGEPAIDGDPGGSSIWFTWTAPSSGTVQVSDCETTFAPLLAVYTGTSLSTLTPVAAAVGEAHRPCNASPFANGQLSFQAVVGTRYDFALDGRGGASGASALGIVMGDGTATVFRDFIPPPPIDWTPQSWILSRRIDGRAGTAVFRLGSSLPGSSFQCTLDRRRAVPCGATVRYRHLKPGIHLFRAEAVAPSGAIDDTPAREPFKLAKGRPRTHTPAR